MQDNNGKILKQREEKDIQQGLLVKQEKKSFLFKRGNFIRRWQTQLTDTYLIIKKLGQGSFGQVFLIIHKHLKVKRALKIIKKRLNSSSNIYDQLQLLKQLDHPNIIKIYQYYESTQKLYIITEYFHGHELFDEIVQSGYLSQSIAVMILGEILKALAYIHSNKIAHRDIKAENILVRKNGEEYVVKVIDWGLSSLIDQKGFTRRCGTIQYLAPEVFSQKYNLECDMWSFGVLTFIMLSGRMPFKGKTKEQTIKQLKRGYINLDSQLWKTISVQAKSFIQALIQKNTQLRMKAQQGLKHPWITTHISPQNNKQLESNLEKTLIRIREFNNQTKFQVVVINFILNFINMPKQQQKLKKQFELLDLNGDGSISKSQLHHAYTKIYGPEAQLIVEQIFKKIDLDGSGGITFSQFLTFATQITHNFNEKQLKQAFNLFDRDHDGYIDKNEINNLIEYERSTVEDEAFQEIINQIDLNDDGKIDFQEFVCHINRAVKKVRSRTSSSLGNNHHHQSSQRKEQDHDEKSSQIKKQGMSSSQIINLDQTVRLQPQEASAQKPKNQQQVIHQSHQQAQNHEQKK